MPTCGACTYSYLWELSLEDTVNRLAEIGFPYFELMATPPHCWPRDWSPASRVAFRRLCESRGIRVSSVNPTYLDLNLASTNPGIREETVRQLREAVGFAHDIEAGVVVVVAGKKHPLLAPEPSHLWRLVREGIDALLPECDRLGVTLAIENGWTVIDRAADLVRLCREVSHSRLRVAYDVANAFMAESPIEGLELVSGALALLHLSDTGAARWGHERIGAGAIDFSAVTEKVLQIGYAGPTVLEIVDLRTPDESNRASLERLQALGWNT